MRRGASGKGQFGGGKGVCFTLAGAFDAVADADCLAVADVLVGVFAPAFVLVVLEVRHCGVVCRVD